MFTGLLLLHDPTYAGGCRRSSWAAQAPSSSCIHFAGEAGEGGWCMGKVTKPVTIIVTDKGMLEWSEFVKMNTQGHRIVALEDVLLGSTPDDPPFALVMGPRAHLMLEGMEKLIPVAVKGARAELYPKKGKDT